MQTDPDWSHIVRLADLSARKPTKFTLTPDEKTIQAIVAELDLLGLKKLRFSGELAPKGKHDWRLTAQLGATATQPCIVTLAPVTTRIDEEVSRTYVSEQPEFISGSEVEMPDDDTVEPLTATVDLGTLMLESLTLALPLYPRAKGAQLLQTVFTEPGAEPMTDEAARPFASLKALRDKLGKDDE